MKCSITIYIRKHIKGQKSLGPIYDVPAADIDRSCDVLMALGEAASFIEAEYKTQVPVYQIKQAKGSTYYKRFYRINFTDKQKKDIRKNCADGVRRNLVENDFAGSVIINIYP
jgi:hypothetical protein